MPTYSFETVDVFTDKVFGGNPLAVFPDARGLSTEQMQALAAEMNYSETSFVLPPDNPANTARVRIFNRTSEMPFAGHPNVGTACVLARLAPTIGHVLRFEEISGLVEVRLLPNGGAEIDAPQPLRILDILSPAAVASCLSLKPSDIDLAIHGPVRATVGIEFILVAVASDALGHAVPDLNAFRMLADSQPELGGRLSIFFYCREDRDIRARMFAPLAGTWEDPATGSANATLAALRLSLTDDCEIAYKAEQGVEMGRRSELVVRAWRAEDGIRASVAGNCRSVFSGTVTL